MDATLPRPDVVSAAGGAVLEPEVLDENASPDKPPTPPPITVLDRRVPRVGGPSTLGSSGHAGPNASVATPGLHSGLCTKRLALELRRHQEDPFPFISFAPISDDLPDSPYEGGTFYIRMDTPPMYPFKPPTFTFVTKVYHPNISAQGRICMDGLSEGWTPIFTLPSLLLAIYCLLCEPNFEESFIPGATEENRQEFETTARQYTRKWAMDGPPADVKIENAGGEGLEITWDDYMSDSDEEMEHAIQKLVG
ncbi:MAG: hypothetical protein M1839_001432 [Geoglossum umbratile]|nr:MAG: hypothetical protein M1839_001432 [Geoglossum umbratile]